MFFKHFKEYLGISGVIDAYSATLTLPWNILVARLDSGIILSQNAPT